MSRSKRPTGIRPYGPGKFDTVLDSLVYGQDGGPDEECGMAPEEGCWHGLYRAPILSEYSELTQDEETLLQTSIGCIATEDGQGFVTIDYHDTEDGLAAAWQACEAEHAGADDDD